MDGPPIIWPWEMQGELVKQEPFGFETPLGTAVGFLGVFSDGTNTVALKDPKGNARFARMRPETGYALEEGFDSAWAPEVSEQMSEAWTELMANLAKANRALRRERQDP